MSPLDILSVGDWLRAVAFLSARLGILRTVEQHGSWPCGLAFYTRDCSKDSVDPKLLSRGLAQRLKQAVRDGDSNPSADPRSSRRLPYERVSTPAGRLHVERVARRTDRRRLRSPVGVLSGGIQTCTLRRCAAQPGARLLCRWAIRYSRPRRVRVFVPAREPAKPPLVPPFAGNHQAGNHPGTQTVHPLAYQLQNHSIRNQVAAPHVFHGGGHRGTAFSVPEAFCGAKDITS